MAEIGGAGSHTEGLRGPRRANAGRALRAHGQPPEDRGVLQTPPGGLIALWGRRVLRLRLVKLTIRRESQLRRFRTAAMEQIVCRKRVGSGHLRRMSESGQE